MARNYQTNDVYNEVDRRKRQKAERKADPKIFFNKVGNPFLGFMHFLERTPVPPKPIDEQRLISDFIYDSKKRHSINIGSLLVTFVLMMVPCLMIYAAPSLLMSKISPIAIFIIAILFIVLMFVVNIVSKSRKKRKQTSNYYTVEDYKNYVVHRAIGDEVQELVYEPYFGIPQSVCKDLGVVLLGNIYGNEDLITGKYRDVYFAQSDLIIQYESGSNDDNTYELETHFRGRWIGIEYPKKFEGTVIITDNSYAYVPKRKDLEYVELENINFNRMFTVRSNDAHLVYYLLTPQIMERLMYLRENARGNVVASFKDGILHIFINNGKDSFEPNRYQVDLMRDIQNFKYDFSLVSGIAAILNINDNIYVQHNEEPSYQQPYQNNPMPPMNNNGFSN